MVPRRTHQQKRGATSRCKKPLPRFKFKICRASEKFRQADKTWTQPTPGGAPQPVFGSRGHKNGRPSTGTRCSAPMALGWCWWPQEAHGGHQTSPGGTGDVQGMFSCQGWHGAALMDRERPILRYLLSCCQRRSPNYLLNLLNLIQWLNGAAVS